MWFTGNARRRLLSLWILLGHLCTCYSAITFWEALWPSRNCCNVKEVCWDRVYSKHIKSALLYPLTYSLLEDDSTLYNCGNFFFYVEKCILPVFCFSVKRNEFISFFISFLQVILAYWSVVFIIFILTLLWMELTSNPTNSSSYMKHVTCSHLHYIVQITILLSCFHLFRRKQRDRETEQQSNRDCRVE